MHSFQLWVTRTAWTRIVSPREAPRGTPRLARRSEDGPGDSDRAGGDTFPDDYGAGRNLLTCALSVFSTQ